MFELRSVRTERDPVHRAVSPVTSRCCNVVSYLLLARYPPLKNSRLGGRQLLDAILLGETAKLRPMTIPSWLISTFVQYPSSETTHSQISKINAEASQHPTSIYQILCNRLRRELSQDFISWNFSCPGILSSWPHLKQRPSCYSFHVPPA